MMTFWTSKRCLLLLLFIFFKENLDCAQYLRHCAVESGGGAVQYQMNTGVRLTLPKAGAFAENTASKNEGTFGEKPNFGSKLGGIGWECYFKSFRERFKSRNLQKQIVKTGKNDQFVDEIETKSSFLWQPNAKIGGLWVRAIKKLTFHQNMLGLWVTAETISKDMGSLGDNITALKIGGLWTASPP